MPLNKRFSYDILLAAMLCKVHPYSAFWLRLTDVKPSQEKEEEEKEESLRREGSPAWQSLYTSALEDGGGSGSTHID